MRVRPFFKVLAVPVVLFFPASYAMGRMMLVSAWESGESLRPSLSSAQAEHDGLLVRRIPIATRYLPVGSKDSARVSDVWVERRSTLQYRYYYLRTRDTVGGEQLAMMLDRPMRSGREIRDLDDGPGVKFLRADVDARRASIHRTNAIFYFWEVHSPYPDSFRIVVCQEKVYANGIVNSSPVKWLPACPSEKLSPSNSR